MNEALWIIACMVPAGMAVTYVWRLLGVMAVAHIDPESDLLLWVRAVSTALVAALVMRIVIAPSGVLADIGLVSRLAAIAVGIGVFYVTRRSTNIATFASVGALGVLALVLG
jgi:branched-subunit amino acid transport protein